MRNSTEKEFWAIAMNDKAVEETQRTIEKIIDCCRHEDAVVAAYIFGSASANRMKPSSDLDIALLLESGSESSFPQFQFGADLTMSVLMMGRFLVFSGGIFPILIFLWQVLWNI